MTTDAWNYYEVLEVPNEATQDSIYHAYRRAKETYSLANPRIFNTFTESEAIAWIGVIEEAYSVIGHPNTRRMYDLEMQSSIRLVKPPTKDSPQVVPNIDTQSIPDGYRKTAVSQYECKADMESLIEKQELFDGLFLKKVREYKNIDLTHFSQHTCIAIRHLYAIENNNFSVLPAAVFVRGYIIQYCRVLGLDQRRVVSSFMSLLENE